MKTAVISVREPGSVTAMRAGELVPQGHIDDRTPRTCGDGLAPNNATSVTRRFVHGHSHLAL